MEVFDNWERVRPIYQRFKDPFIARVPKNANWAADGADVLVLALSIERTQKHKERGRIEVMDSWGSQKKS